MDEYHASEAMRHRATAAQRHAQRARGRALTARGEAAAARRHAQEVAQRAATDRARWLAVRGRLAALCNVTDFTCYLDTELRHGPVCDHTFARTTGYFAPDGGQADEAITLLSDMGAHCDCAAQFLLRLHRR
jgi:hypothetical protein